MSSDADTSSATGTPTRSLVDRLLGLLIIGGLGVGLLAVVGLYFVSGRLVEDALRKQAVHWVGELDELGTPLYVSTRTEPALRVLAARLERAPEVAYVRYYAADRRLLGQYGRTGSVAALSEEEASAADAVAERERGHVLVEGPGDLVRTIAPVKIVALPAGGLADLERGARRQTVRVIGYLDFGLDAGQERAAFRRALVAGALALGFVVLVAVLWGRHLVRRALAPLVALQEPLARLARGELEVQVGGGGDREIVAIRDALNTTVEALKQREDALRRAQCDAVTGLANQRYFERALELEHKRLKGSGESSAVLYIDLDRFRHVNDALSRVAGNRLLGQVAGVLRAHIRENDLLARLEGDKFVALVRNVNRDGAVKVARSINRVIQEFQFTEAEEAFGVSASIGVCILDKEQPVGRVLGLAGAACAQAKARGGNRHCLHEPGEAGADLRRAEPGWSEHVGAAIRDNALRLLYQPIVGLSEGAEGERYEALLRLVGTDGELVAPGAFLPLAHRFGLSIEIDHWVIRHACAEAGRLRAEGRAVEFFINLSGQAFDDGEALARVVAEAIESHGVPGRALVFEITEQIAVRHVEQARRVIEEVSRLGCRFALDDFGSGFSSLNYLKNLPVSFIKISGAFVEKAAADTLDELMVRSIVQIARALGKETIAESVEDRRTFQLLADIGADYAQGYFLARPAEALPEPGFFHAERLRRLREVRPATRHVRRGPRSE